MQSNTRLTAPRNRRVHANTPQSATTYTYLNNSCDNCDADCIMLQYAWAGGNWTICQRRRFLCGSEKVKPHHCCPCVRRRFYLSKNIIRSTLLSPYSQPLLTSTEPPLRFHTPALYFFLAEGVEYAQHEENRQAGRGKRRLSSVYAFFSCDSFSSGHVIAPAGTALFLVHQFRRQRLPCETGR